MAQHTPGPWIRYIGGPIMAYGSVDTVSCAVLVPVAVAKPTSDYDSDGRHFTLPGCPAANSMLIAAAPDMLAALKGLVENPAFELGTPIVAGRVGSGKRGAAVGAWEEFVQAARVAIAKAEGRS